MAPPKPLLCLALAVLPACGSVAERRVPATIASPKHSLEVEFWARDHSESTRVYLISFDTLLFPIDALASIWWSCEALADEDLRIQWGPLGALGAILLPWCSARFDLRSEDRNDRNYDNLQPATRRVVLPVAEAWIESWQQGRTSLQELTAVGLSGANLDSSIQRWSGAADLQADVRQGRVEVTATGPLRPRYAPGR